MQVLRRAAVLTLLGLSFGIPGVQAATARPEVRSQTARSTANRFEPWWNLLSGTWAKAGCRIDPWGLCGIHAATQLPTTDAGCTIDPWGRCGVSSVRQAPDMDAGCRIDPLGLCLGH
jgi:hypothetical protein